MKITEKLKDKHIDALYDWVEKEKWDDVIDYCNGEVSTLDDDLEDALIYYVESNEDQLFEEFFNLKK
jgi:hypothetical protein